MSQAETSNPLSVADLVQSTRAAMREEYLQVVERVAADQPVSQDELKPAIIFLKDEFDGLLENAKTRFNARNRLVVLVPELEQAEIADAEACAASRVAHAARDAAEVAKREADQAATAAYCQTSRTHGEVERLRREIEAATRETRKGF